MANAQNFTTSIYKSLVGYISATERWKIGLHYSDVIMSSMASQITDVSIVYSTVCSGADQRKKQSSASLAFVRGIHRWPMTSLHKWPVKQKLFPFDDVIMSRAILTGAIQNLKTKIRFLNVVQSYFCIKFMLHNKLRRVRCDNIILYACYTLEQLMKNM